MDDSLIEIVASNVGEDVDNVASIIDEFCLLLHKTSIEYKGLNGDYIGEKLSHDLPPQGFYHLLRFLERFSDKYEWEQGITHEYLMRLADRKHWLPFIHQVEGWKPDKD